MKNKDLLKEAPFFEAIIRSIAFFTLTCVFVVSVQLGDIFDTVVSGLMVCYLFISTSMLTYKGLIK